MPASALRPFYPNYQAGTYNPAMPLPLNHHGQQMYDGNNHFAEFQDSIQFSDIPYPMRDYNSLPQSQIEETDLDFANFPWLPDFDSNNQNFQGQVHVGMGPVGNPVYEKSIINKAKLGSSSADSCSELSGGEVETVTKKSFKRKSTELDLTEEGAPEGESVVDRRERNRLNAKKARLRKKQLLGSLQGQLALLRGENAKLRRVIAARIPEKQLMILNRSDHLPEILTTAAN